MVVSAKKAALQFIRITHALVNFTVLLGILLFVAVALYAMWDSDQVYQTAGSTQYAVYKPSAEEQGGPSFAQLQAINPEVFSWLTVYGTNIDYPVTQGEDNAKYVNTSAMRSYSLAGAIFLDYRNSNRFDDFNSILYGHHMEKQAMFGEVEYFADQAFFDGHAYGNLYYAGEDHGLEFFAFMKTDAYDGGVFFPNIQGEEARQAFLDYLLGKATHTRDTGVTIQDRIVLLTTCSSDSTNGRDILAARITDQSYEDTFVSNTPRNDNERQTVSVDRQTDLWKNILPWFWIGLWGLLMILIILAIYHILRKRARRGIEIWPTYKKQS